MALPEKQTLLAAAVVHETFPVALPGAALGAGGGLDGTEHGGVGAGGGEQGFQLRLAEAVALGHVGGEGGGLLVVGEGFLGAGAGSESGGGQERDE